MSAGFRCPGVRFYVPGSTIHKNKLWIDFLYSEFFGYIITFKINDLGEAVMHTVNVTVTPY